MKNTLFSTAGIILIFATLLLSSCEMKSSFYQKQVGIPQALWASDFQPEFEVKIEDSTEKKYNLFFLLRHDDAYPYSNIWFKLKIKKPGDSTFSDGIRIEKDLADTEGKWLGLGVNDIWEHKFPLQLKDTTLFKETGTYYFKIEQIMRTNLLPSVLNVGLIVEKRQ